MIVTKGDILKLEKAVDQSNLMKDPTLKKTFLKEKSSFSEGLKNRVL